MESFSSDFYEGSLFILVKLKTQNVTLHMMLMASLALPYAARHHP